MNDSRVCVVLGGLDYSGGMFNYLKLSLQEYKRKNYFVTVVATKKTLSFIEGDLFDTCFFLPYDTNIGVKQVFINFAIGKYNPQMKELSSNIENGCYDLVHFVDETIYIGFFFYFFPKKMKLMITIHDSIFHPGQFKNILTFLVAYFNRALFLRKKRLVLHFHSKRSSNVSFLKYANTKFISPHPLPKPRFKSKKNVVKKISFVGKITPYKGIDIFLDAISELDEYELDFQVLIAGSGDFNSKKIENLKHNLVVKNEYLTNYEFELSIANSDIICLPYTSATQSGVGMLAKAYNKIIICTNVGDLADLLDENCEGELIEPNSNSLKIALKKYVKKS